MGLKILWTNWTCDLKFDYGPNVMITGNIKTHDSESRGQAVRDEQVCYLQVAPL